MRFFAPRRSLLLVLALVFATPAMSATQSGVSVYLMRGLMDVSTGLDDLAAKLRTRGIAAVVDGYSARDHMSEAAIRAYKSGRVCRIVIVGHSLGADAAVDMAVALMRAGVPVALLVSFSAASNRQLPANVAHVVNYFQSGGMFDTRLIPASSRKGSVRNVDLAADGTINHFNIEKVGRLHAQTLRMITALSGPCTPHT